MRERRRSQKSRYADLKVEGTKYIEKAKNRHTDIQSDMQTHGLTQRTDGAQQTGRDHLDSLDAGSLGIQRGLAVGIRGPAVVRLHGLVTRGNGLGFLGLGGCGLCQGSVSRKKESKNKWKQFE